MTERPRPSRIRRTGPSRFLAPVALAVVVLAFIVILAGHGGSGNSGNTGAPAGAGSTTTAHTTPRVAKHGRAHAGSGPAAPTTTGPTGTGTSTTGTGTSTVGSYTVASGDTFGAIAAKTGVSVTRIEQLNPGVSSSALTVGQVLKLR